MAVPRAAIVLSVITGISLLLSSIWVGISAKGFLDDIDIEHVHAFEEGLLEYMNSSAKATKEKLVESKSFKGLEDEFNTAISEYKANFTV